VTYTTSGCAECLLSLKRLLSLKSCHSLVLRNQADFLVFIVSMCSIGQQTIHIRGMAAYKLFAGNATSSVFNGSPDASWGCHLDYNSIFFDKIYGKNLFIAHGVNRVMMPAKILE